MYFKSLEMFQEHIETISYGKEDVLMIMVGEKSAEDIPSITEFLNSKGIRFFGGIFPGLLVQNRHLRKGMIAILLKSVYCSVVLPFMMRLNMDLKEMENCTAFVVVDGLSEKMKELTDTLYGKLGNNVKYIGGGAGYYDLNHRGCVFDNKGIYKDVLYVCVAKTNAQLAVRHGWNKLRGPFTVKEAYDNVLSRLDDDTAFEVYKNVIEEVEGIILSKEDFFSFAKDHPFGIIQEDGTVVVRDPISINENDEIICVASIPEGSEIYVLKGDADTLLSSSLQIAEYCADKAPPKYLPILFDCISRSMFLEDRFEEELINIQNKLDFAVEGALSIGEISSKRNGELIIHNKSTILGIIYEQIKD